MTGAVRRLLRTSFILVLLMILYSIVSYFDRSIISIAGLDMMREFHLSETQMGGVYSAFLFGYALAMVPGGYIADWLGPSRTLTAVGFGAALFTALTSFGGRPGLGALMGIVPALISIRLLLGISTAPLYPACARMIANQFPNRRRGLISGLVAGSTGIGSALSPSLFVWLLSLFAWRKSFWLAGAATMILAGAWWFWARDWPSGNRPRSPSAKDQIPSPRVFRELLADRNVALLTLGYSTVGYFEYIFFYWIYYYFKQIRHMSHSEVSIYTTMIFLAWVVMAPVGGFLSDYLIQKIGNTGRRVVPLAGIVAGVVLFVVGSKMSSLGWLGFLFALSFGSISSSDGPFWSTMIVAGRESAGAACGILNTGSSVGGFIALVLTPFIASILGWSMALYFGCAVALSGVSIWFLLREDTEAAHHK